MVLQVRRKRTHFQQRSWKIQQQKRHRQAPPAKMDTVPHVAHVHMFHHVPMSCSSSCNISALQLEGPPDSREGQPLKQVAEARTPSMAPSATPPLSGGTLGRSLPTTNLRSGPYSPPGCVSNPPKFNENYMSAISYVTISNEMSCTVQTKHVHLTQLSLKWINQFGPSQIKKNLLINV